MAAPVTVRVLRDVTIGGVARVRGELVTLAPIDAVMWARRGAVSLSRDVVPAPRPARRYRRRDLRAED